jgi:hypothetical protein
MALLGIEHVERNGHHYYRGLSLWPDDWQAEVLAAHGDLYCRHAQGFACLQIRAGRLELGSVNAAPFGVQPLPDPTHFARQAMPQSGQNNIQFVFPFFSVNSAGSDLVFRTATGHCDDCAKESPDH